MDEGERSWDAIALGQQLSCCSFDGLSLVYVHTLEGLDALLTGHRRQEFEDLAARDASARLADVRARTEELGLADVQLVTARSAAEGLSRQAADTNAALIVTGSSNRSGLGRLLPGATAERLMSGSPVPVAVAPRGYCDRGRLASVGVGFDDSPESHLAVNWAAELASRCGVGLQLIAVHTPLALGGAVGTGALATESVEQALGQELQAKGETAIGALPSDLSVEFRFLKGGPTKVLVDLSRRLDLLVLGSRGYGPMKSVLLGSVSSYLVRNAHCPLLIVPRDGNDD